MVKAAGEEAVVPVRESLASAPLRSLHMEKILTMDLTHRRYANPLASCSKSKTRKATWDRKCTITGSATLALAECYGMVDDKRIAPALKKAVALILKAQKNNPRGGWRYDPHTRHADTTVSGCQIVALLAARNAGIPVPDKAIDKGLAYMKSCRSSNGAYGYTSKGSGRLTLTAIGSLCYSLAKRKDEAGFAKSTEYLKKNIRAQDGTYPFYFRYYMSQALFQANEELWQAWNKDNIRLLSATQLPDGSWAGNHGNAFSTSGALLSLALKLPLLTYLRKMNQLTAAGLLCILPLSAIAEPTKPESEPDMIRFSNNANNDTLHGKFLAFKSNDTLTFENPEAQDPITFSTQKLHRITLGRGRERQTLSPTSTVTLINGDIIPGKIVQADAKTVVLDTEHMNQVTLPADTVSVISPTPHGGKLIYYGPLGQDGWKAISPPKDEKEAKKEPKNTKKKNEKLTDWRLVAGAWYAGTEKRPLPCPGKCTN